MTHGTDKAGTTERAGRADKAGSQDPRALRLGRLRQELVRRRLDGFVVPRADEHQGEYVPPRAERLAWLTGFTGSAGVAVVLREAAAIFVDGRYTLQAAQQVEAGLVQPLHLPRDGPEAWIVDHLGEGGRLGYDPWLHTVDGAARLEAACEKAGGALAACADNPLDAVWEDQPGPPLAPVVPHPLEYAGRAAADKRRELGQALADDGVDAAVLTQPDSIAWLLNVRGGDVPHSPLPLSFAILRRDGGVDLFLDRRKLSPGLEAHLGAGVEIHEPAAFGPALDALGRKGRRRAGKVRLDPASAAAWVYQRLKAAKAELAPGADPCSLPKACKNEVELAGARAAHRRDGAALTRFLAWLAAAAPGGALTEIEARDRLEAFRRESNLLRDLSFDTISGAGPNGAIVHYRVSEESNRRLEPGTLYLVDSGGQYPDGTTDVTRTVAIGAPTAEMRDRFTRVLKGHIALATIRFPGGTTGAQLDVLARRFLWEAGLDYDHGTGHGVGSYLGVHEGPQRISKLPNAIALRPGMICSNEPGYYKAGAYGIRIENLVAVRPDPDGAGQGEGQGDEQEMLGFETLTQAPIDCTLVDPGLMTDRETAWLDEYHAGVRETLTPLVDEATAAWLAEATQPLSASRAPATPPR